MSRVEVERAAASSTRVAEQLRERRVDVEESAVRATSETCRSASDRRGGTALVGWPRHLSPANSRARPRCRRTRRRASARAGSCPARRFSVSCEHGREIDEPAVRIGWRARADARRRARPAASTPPSCACRRRAARDRDVREPAAEQAIERRRPRRRARRGRARSRASRSPRDRRRRARLSQLRVDRALSLSIVNLHALGLDDDDAARAAVCRLRADSTARSRRSARRSASVGLPASREQREVGAGGDRGRHREVAAVAAHDLDDERAVVRGRGVGDLVARLDDRVHRGVDADRQAGAARGRCRSTPGCRSTLSGRPLPSSVGIGERAARRSASRCRR